MLVPPGDPAALGAALRRWLGDAELRGRLRRAARERRVCCAAGRQRVRRRGGADGGRRRARGSGAMSAQADRVPLEWLVLREPADAEARSAELADRLRGTCRRARSSSTTSAAAGARWGAGSLRGCPGRSTGSCTTGTRTCWRSPRPASRRGAPTSPGWRRKTSPGRACHRLGAARHADRGRARPDAAPVRRPAHAARDHRHRPRHVRAGGPARRASGRGVQRPPAARRPARAGRRRGRPRRAPRGGARAAEPVAARCGATPS